MKPTYTFISFDFKLALFVSPESQMLKEVMISLATPDSDYRGSFWFPWALKACLHFPILFKNWKELK